MRFTVLAPMLGKSYATVLAYRSGRRQPPADVLDDLASIIEARSSALQDGANTIRGQLANPDRGTQP
jgi:hypothetical protein